MPEGFPAVRQNRPGGRFRAALARAGQLCRAGRPGDARAICETILEEDPCEPNALHLLGSMHAQSGDYASAITLITRAIQLRPGFAMAHNNLGKVLLRTGRGTEAIRRFERAIELEPDYASALALLLCAKRQLCDWKGIGALRGRLVNLVDRKTSIPGDRYVDPFTFLVAGSDARQQLACASVFARLHCGTPRAESPQLRRVTRSRTRKTITIGYLSSGFGIHATSTLVPELFELHDRGRFEIIGYSLAHTADCPMRRRITRSLDRFRELSRMPAADAARTISADGVDILVDLNGYTWGARPEITALRPAPVQVNYLGYPGTMGAGFIDYIIADNFVLPPDQYDCFSETPVIMPHCYQVNDRQRLISPEQPGRSACGLPEDAFVFCCFNAAYKITPDIFRVWMRLLKQVQGSVLWLCEERLQTIRNLRAEAGLRGVEPDRLVFAPVIDMPRHLARYRLADLFLDTFPVNAHTTASDALWSGCPVLTCAGTAFASRVAGSLLNAVGLRELIAFDLAEYETRALELARDPLVVKAFRNRLGLSRNSVPLFDTPAFTRQLEWAYKEMWSMHQSKRVVTALRVPELR